MTAATRARPTFTPTKSCGKQDPPPLNSNISLSLSLSLSLNAAFGFKQWKWTTVKCIFHGRSVKEGEGYYLLTIFRFQTHTHTSVRDREMKILELFIYG